MSSVSDAPPAAAPPAAPPQKPRVAPGCVTLGEWWRIGAALISVVNITISMLVGGRWFKALGYW
jgi:hypothetical protein